MGGTMALDGTTATKYLLTVLYSRDRFVRVPGRPVPLLTAPRSRLPPRRPDHIQMEAETRRLSFVHGLTNCVLDLE